MSKHRPFGSLRIRGGSIQIRYSVNGQRVVEAMPRGATKADARALLARRQLEALTGVGIAPSTGTFADLLELWLTDDEGWSPATRRTYRLSVDRLLATGAGRVKLKDLGIGHAEACKKELQDGTQNMSHLRRSRKGTHGSDRAISTGTDRATANRRATDRGAIEPNAGNRAVPRDGQRDLAPKTINEALNRGGDACRWAMQRKLLIANPFAAVKRLTVPKADKRALTPEEAAQLYQACMSADPTDSQSKMVAFLLTNPRRYNEVAALRWTDIDGLGDSQWPDGAHIRHSSRSGSSRQTSITGTAIGAGKTSTPTSQSPTYTIRRGWDYHEHVYMTDDNPKHRHRTYPLLPATARVLDRQRKCIEVLRQRAKDARLVWRDEDLVFPGVDGGPMPLSTLQKGLNRLCEAAGVPRVSVHELKHTAVSLLLHLGVSKNQIVAITGNSWSMIENNYGHFFTDDVVAGLGKLGGLLEGAAG